jgi:protocatechuate 3,4-dioxygenase beta subunit
MKSTLALALFAASASLCAAGVARERVLGSCDGCENVFVEQPAQPAAQARIAAAAEPGEAMVIEGTVRRADGTAAPGIVVYAYHTNAAGIYPRASTRHGALRGWARSDADGHYRFDTIRPGAYPGRDVPQHVHMQVIEPDRGTYYIDDLVFSDDPLLTAAQRQRMNEGRGGSAISDPRKDAHGVWHVRRDITLGQNIAGYPR